MQRNTVQRNGVYGIAVDVGTVSHNVASVNGIGILVAHGSASYNVANRNAAYGIDLGEASYIGNTMSGNGSAPVHFGRNLGQNLCDGAVCPGAQF